MGKSITMNKYLVADKYKGEEEIALPGLSYSPNQMFFLNMAQVSIIMNQIHFKLFFVCKADFMQGLLIFDLVVHNQLLCSVICSSLLIFPSFRHRGNITHCGKKCTSRAC
jgi:hypothetical protein